MSRVDKRQLAFVGMKGYIRLAVLLQQGVQCELAQCYRVLKSIELRHYGDETRILTLDADLVLYSDVLLLVDEGLISLIVSWRPCRAQRVGQPVADAEATVELDSRGIVRL